MMFLTFCFHIMFCFSQQNHTETRNLYLTQVDETASFWQYLITFNLLCKRILMPGCQFFFSWQKLLKKANQLKCLYLMCECLAKKLSLNLSNFTLHNWTFWQLRNASCLNIFSNFFWRKWWGGGGSQRRYLEVIDDRKKCCRRR